jgi:hypothetical protein
MTALPTNSPVPAMLGGHGSWWQAPLFMLGGGIAAASSPGGFANFGAGVTQAGRDWRSMQMERERMGWLRDQAAREQQEFEAEQRRANQEAEQRAAVGRQIAAMFGGSQPGTVDTASSRQPAMFNPVRQIGNYGAAVGGAPQAAMLGPPRKPMPGVPVDAHVGADGIPGTADDNEPMNAGAALPFNFTTQQAQLFQALPVEQQVEILAERGFAEPESPQPRKSRTRDVGDQTIFEEFDPTTGAWSEVSRAPRWAPKPEGGGLSVDINGDGVPDIQMGNIKGEWQSKDNAFANRLDNAIVEMDTVEAEGYDPTATTAGGVADYIGQRSVGGLIGNVMTSDQGKRWYRSAKEALAVFLRKDSGAAVTDHEFELYGPLYVPMPWDDAKTKAAKKQAMLVMRNSLRQGLGQTQMPTPTGAPAPPPGAPAAGGSPDDPLNLFPQQ